MSSRSVLPEPAGGHATPEYLQKQTTLADILQFEQSHPWTRQLRDSLDAQPRDTGAVENALLHMLLEKSHPLSKLRQRLQYSLFCKLNPLVEQHAHLLDAERVPAWSPAAAEAAPVGPAAATAQATPVVAAGQAPIVVPAEEPSGGLWPRLPDSDEETDDGATAAADPESESAIDRREREQQDEAFRRHLRNVISGGCRMRERKDM